MKKSLLTLALLGLFTTAQAQEFGQRKGIRGIVAKKNPTIELN